MEHVSPSSITDNERQKRKKIMEIMYNQSLIRNPYHKQEHTYEDDSHLQHHNNL